MLSRYLKKKKNDKHTHFWMQGVSYILILAGKIMSITCTFIPHTVDKKV